MRSFFYFLVGFFFLALSAMIFGVGLAMKDASTQPAVAVAPSVAPVAR